jgi:nitrogen fixation NifU-like protein
MALDDLYQDLILDHYRRPRNRGALRRPDRSLELYNPLCGDEIAVDLALEGARVADCRFHGQGCSICQASASMMTERVKGRSIAEARTLVSRFQRMMRADAAPGADSELGDLVALRAVVQFPVRIKCAMLAWRALEGALEGHSGKETTTEA